jgi:hypothetical protein
VLINEIAKMAGLSKDGICHYEELGLITSVPRRVGSKTYRARWSNSSPVNSSDIGNHSLRVDQTGFGHERQPGNEHVRPRS